MTPSHTVIRVQGKKVKVPSAEILGANVGVTGRLFRKAAVLDEDFLAQESVTDPEAFVKALRAGPLRADVFTFAQRVPDVQPRYSYRLEWDSAAAVRITTYREWLEKGVEYDVRKAIKKATKLGVVVKAVPFDDELVRGITGIYNECPVRQGKPFWHFQKDFDTIKEEKATFLDRSEFIGAYFENELIGFIKMVYVGGIASTLHVLSQKGHADKKPTNALLAKAVEICEQKGLSHLVYGNYRYDNASSSLTEFKRRNGFQELLVPRYYIPLTVKGRAVLGSGLHHGFKAALPAPLLRAARRTRAAVYKILRPARAETPATEKHPAAASKTSDCKPAASPTEPSAAPKKARQNARDEGPAVNSV